MILNQHSKHRMTARLTLAAFIAVSIGIHVSVLLVNLNRPGVELGTDSTNEISVHISQNTQQVSHDQPVQQNKSSKPKSVTELVNNRSSTELANHSEQQQSQHIASLRQKKIIGQLQQELAHFFYYPPQAQRRGIQGLVLIGFKLTQHGRIDSVSISKSSGYSVLDNAALDAFNQASRSFSAATSSISIYLKIPVKFQLSGG